MKKLTFTIFILMLTLIFLNEKSYSANEQFRSAASGNWNSNATWEMSTNGGSTWFAATSSPNDTSGAITVRSPNTVTVTVNVSADQLVVNNGGTISINSSIIFTLLDGSGVDLTLNSGGIISGSGTFKTLGVSVTVINRNGSTFSAAFQVGTGVTTSYDDGGPYIATYSGPVTINAGATLNTLSGGYSNQSNGTVVNNGIISGNRFIMNGSLLTNNNTISSLALELNSTTSLSGTGAYTSTAISIAGTGNVSLLNNLTFSPGLTFTINTGGILNPNSRVFSFNAGTFVILNGGNVSNSGTFQTQNAVSMNIRAGANFNAPLKVNTGTTTSYDEGGPYIAVYKGTMTIDAGATLTTPSGGYSNLASNTVTNSGSITGNNFIMRGATLTNQGNISPLNLTFDSVTSVLGSGTYTSNTILISGTANVKLLSTITFSPVSSLTINSGGVLTPSSETFAFTSGTFILNSGATVTGLGVAAGVLQTQGNVIFIFRSGSSFNSAVNVTSGILTAYNDQGPYLAVFYGTITINSGATLTVPNGGYNTQANNSLTNNGSITGVATFTIRGPILANNGSITTTNLRFDSTTSISGTGTYTSNTITIGGAGNVSLSNNVTFTPGTSFTISNGGILNPNNKIFNYNSGSFYAMNGSTVLSSGTFQTQSNVNLIVKAGSNFNAPLKVNTGTSTAFDDAGPYNAIFNGTITVDAGATLRTNNGGYTIQANKNVTVNGSLFSFPGAIVRMRGSVLTNNSSISGGNFSFDSTTSIAGAGTNTTSAISISSTGNVSLLNNVTFSPSTFTIKINGILNPNTKIFTLASGSLVMTSGSTVQNSGIFQTQNTVTLLAKNGSNFNCPLKVNTGITVCYDDAGPYTGTLNQTVTIDNGATLSIPAGGYAMVLNNNVINNGTLTNLAGATIKFYGTDLTNNGNVSANLFYFEPGAHTLQGTGSWSANTTVLNGSTVTLLSNHQMSGVAINAGGTFNVSTFKLLLSGTNPIGNSGTFNTTSGTVEYDGTSAQTISTSNVIYNRLRINNSSGTSLAGNVIVNDTLSDLLGHLNLNGNILTISPTGYLTETSGNTVNGTAGYITTTRNLNAPSSLNVGGLGAVLTTSVNIGSTEIRRGHTAQNGLGGNQSILRYFDITPSVNTGLNGTLVYKYDESELNGRVESMLALYRSTNSGTNWILRGGAVNAANNTVTLSGIDAFSRWSATSNLVAAQIKILIEGFYNNAANSLNMRDTVRAYLRNIASPYAVVDSAKSPLDSLTFLGTYNFNNAPSGTYYIQLKHRNSIETWSKSGGVSYVRGAVLNYDFTSAASQAFGNNLTLKGSKYCIYSGDITQDGSVDLTDLSLVDNAAANFLSGYVNTDVNGDNFVDLSDYSIVDNNAYNFVGKVIP